ncbi:MAG: four helix bundle protein [Flavobacteriales bacterium]
MENEQEFNVWEWMSSFTLEGLSEPTVNYAGASPKRNAVVEETFEMALGVMVFSERLVKINTVFADQILRSGTAVGSHTREAQNAESAADFLHKMKIDFKELEETEYRLALGHRKPHYPHDDELLTKVRKLFPLFKSIILSTRLRVNAQRKK